MGVPQFKRDSIEWSSYAGVWIHQRWLLFWIRSYKEGKTRDPRNKGLKTDVRGELQDEFHVCKINISNLLRTGPVHCLKFLKELAARAMPKCTAQIGSMINKEKIRNRWGTINH